MQEIVKDRSKELLDKGYVIFPLLQIEDVEKIADYYYQFQKEEPQHFYSSSHSPNFEFRKKSSDFIRQIVEPAIASYLTDYKLLGGAFVVKPANGKGILQAHQDWNLVDETQHRSYNIWIPLVDVNEKNGAIYVLEGSHNKMQTFRGPNIPSVFKNIEQELWPYLKILPMKAGEALFYDHALLHGSQPNFTEKVRLGIVVGVIASNAKMQLYGMLQNNLEVFHTDENFFLQKNPMTDYTTLERIPSERNTNPVLSLSDFKSIYIQGSKAKKGWFNRLFKL